MEQQQPLTEETVFNALRECFDPEIPINIVELGLVYDIQIIDDWVGIKMTLTTPGCGLANHIANMVRERVLQIPGVKECDIRLVWDPQWNPSMMSPQAKKMLGVPE